MKYLIPVFALFLLFLLCQLLPFYQTHLKESVRKIESDCKGLNQTDEEKIECLINLRQTQGRLFPVKVAQIFFICVAVLVFGVTANMVWDLEKKFRGYKMKFDENGEIIAAYKSHQKGVKKDERVLQRDLDRKTEDNMRLREEVERQRLVIERQRQKIEKQEERIDFLQMADTTTVVQQSPLNRVGHNPPMDRSGQRESHESNSNTNLFICLCVGVCGIAIAFAVTLLYSF